MELFEVNQYDLIQVDLKIQYNIPRISSEWFDRAGHLYPFSSESWIIGMYDRREAILIQYYSYSVTITLVKLPVTFVALSLTSKYYTKQ